MIENIRLKNFKCFEEQTISFRKVNILTGLNGMGKSTVIQSLLLLKQSCGGTLEKGRISLNGNMIQLGVGRDILYEAAEDDSFIGITLSEKKTEYPFLMEYAPFSDELILKQECEKLPEALQKGKMVYLSSYRIPPVKMYGITNEQDLEVREFGTDGTYALQYLKEYGPRGISGEFAKEEETNTLYEQTKHWMNEIAPGVSIEVDIDIKKQIASLAYSFTEGKNQTNNYNCVNVGFGITYVLPIIVALLSAKLGDVILLENPEAHIHPYGQRKLGELIALAGTTGAQIIAETHSDHILNGIRIAVKNGVLPRTDTNILYFYKDEADEFRHKIETPHINDDGRIDKWPKGFFDEWDNALLELL